MTSMNVKRPVRLVKRVPSQQRSPYSVDRAPLDGSASRLSRPYLPAFTDLVVHAELSAVVAR
ncbi:hypothetical protein [Streptomyces sp. NPDC000878]